MRKPLENVSIFSERRAKLAKMMNGSAMVLAAPAEAKHFRQNSNFYYLTGFEEADSIFVFRPGQTPETVMFVRPKDRERETWDGFRYGPEGTQENFRMEKAYLLSDFDKEIGPLLKNVDRVFYQVYDNPDLDQKMKTAMQNAKAQHNRTGWGFLPIADAAEILGELRVIKSEAEIHNLRTACSLSAEAHNELMHYVRPGMNERELHGYFKYQIMKRGAAREGYGGIVAGGANACTLHYVFNDQPVAANQLLLVDAGGEYNYYTADITRTFPVSGKFTAAQAEVYKGVLHVQKTLIEMVKPGVPFQQFHDVGASMLTDLMLELGLLTGRKEDIIAAGEHKKYYPHGIGHFLGLDVHDVGAYFTKPDKTPRPIQAGMVFTIEPGLYIPADDKKAPPEYRGIGVRIEDNILVTAHGYENLTDRAYKEIVDLEAHTGK